MLPIMHSGPIFRKGFKNLRRGEWVKGLYFTFSEVKPIIVSGELASPSSRVDKAPAGGEFHAQNLSMKGGQRDKQHTLMSMTGKGWKRGPHCRVACDNEGKGEGGVLLLGS